MQTRTQIRRVIAAGRIARGQRLMLLFEHGRAYARVERIDPTPASRPQLPYWIVTPRATGLPTYWATEKAALTEAETWKDAAS